MDGREPEVACVYCIATFFFEVGQKGFDYTGRELLDRHLSRFCGVALGHKVKEQSQGIAVSFNGFYPECVRT